MDNSIKIISSSKVAALISGDPISGTPERQEFGKKFEEAYQYACWAWKGVPWRDFDNILPVQADSSCPRCGRTTTVAYVECSYCRRRWHPGCSVFAGTEVNGSVACRDCTGRAIMATFDGSMGKNDEASAIAAEFFRAGVRGLTPSTMFRQIPAVPGHYIAAKPDLKNENGTWFEFKTYPIRNYAVVQCKIFSWVVGRPIVLVTWDGERVKKTKIDARDFAIPPLPESWFDDRPSGPGKKEA